MAPAAPSALAKFPKSSLRPDSELRLVTTRALFCAGANADVPSNTAAATNTVATICFDMIALILLYLVFSCVQNASGMIDWCEG